MASRDKRKGTKKQNKTKGRDEGRKYNIMEILTLAIAVFALVVSIVSAWYTTHYAQMEYAYKIDPQIAVRGIMEVEKNPEFEEDLQAAMSEINVYILERNNLARAYVIYADNRVETLELDNMGAALEGKVESGLKTEPNIKEGQWEYRYFFVYLESLDGDGTLYLIYTKSAPGVITFNGVSGIEVYGLENEIHKNEEDYKGERIMAQEYVRILRKLPEYMNQ